MHLNALPGRPARRRQRGLSLVEMMVGVAIGLFIVAGATVLMAGQLRDNRQLLLETQIQQDMRAAADIMTRELRRTGYWGMARTGVWFKGTTGVQANPYQTDAVDASVANTGDEINAVYSKATATREIEEDNAVVDAERVGFKVVNGELLARVGANWQALTDSTALKVTALNVAMNTQTITLSCFKACVPGTACPPTQAVRTVTVDIAGEAMRDPSVKRSVRTEVRLRNDRLQGACPV